MILLNIEASYTAKFKEAKFATARGRKGRGSGTRSLNYRALNFELEVFDEQGSLLGILPGGIPETGTSTHNNPVIRFFRSIGIFRDPKEFDPNELNGLKVMITVNNICDAHGLRSVVDHFYPQMV